MPDHLKRVAEDLCDLEATKEFLGVAKGEPCAEAARRLADVSPGMAVNDCRTILGAGVNESLVDAANRKMRERDVARSNLNEALGVIQRIREILGASSEESPTGAATRVMSMLNDRWAATKEREQQIRTGQAALEREAEVRQILGADKDETLSSAAKRVVAERDAAYGKINELQREIQKLECAEASADELTSVLKIMGAVPYPMPSEQASMLRSLISDSGDTIWEIVERIRGKLPHHSGWSLAAKVDDVLHERDRLRAQVAKLEEEAKATAPRLERAKVDHDLLNEIYGLLYWFGPASSKSTFEERLLEKVSHAIALAKEAKEAQRAKSASVASDRICADELAKWRHVGMRALSIVDMIRGDASDDVAKALRDLLANNF